MKALSTTATADIGVVRSFSYESVQVGMTKSFTLTCNYFIINNALPQQENSSSYGSGSTGSYQASTTGYGSYGNYGQQQQQSYGSYGATTPATSTQTYPQNYNWNQQYYGQQQQQQAYYPQVCAWSRYINLCLMLI